MWSTSLAINSQSADCPARSDSRRHVSGYRLGIWHGMRASSALSRLMLYHTDCKCARLCICQDEDTQTHMKRSVSRRSDRTAGMEVKVTRPLLPWLGRACRVAREERNVVQVKIAAAIEVNQATIARFEDATAWPRHPRRC